jgi:ankyrin repeat protein
MSLDKQNTGSSVPAERAMDAQSSSLDDTILSEVELSAGLDLDGRTAQNENPYEQWGGLAAVLGSLLDRAEALAADPALVRSLQKLDDLQNADRTVVALTAAMQRCGFDNTERNRLNSPLLDGLWAVLNCDLSIQQEATRHFPMAGGSPRELLARGILLSVDPSTLAFLFQMPDDYANALNELLPMACRKGHVPSAEFLLNKGVDVNVVFGTGETPLSIAVVKVHMPLARMLLARGAKVDSHFSLLACACETGHLDTVSLLLAHGAQLKPGSFWDHPIRYAARNGHVAVVKFLCDHGVALSTITANDFLEVCRGGHCEMAEYLLDRGHDVRHDNDAALRYATLRHHVEMVAMLLRRLTPVMGTVNLVPSVRAAVEAESAPVLMLLLAHSTAVHNLNLSASLIDAARSGSVPVMSLLLDRGAAVNADNNRPLLNAIDARSLPAITLLLDRGADLRAVTAAALVNAIRSESTELLELLLGRGADLRLTYDAMCAEVTNCHNEAVLQLLLIRASALGLDTQPIERRIQNIHSDATHCSPSTVT